MEDQIPNKKSTPQKILNGFSRFHLSYQRSLKLQNGFKTFFIVILLMALTATTVWAYFTNKEATRSMEALTKVEMEVDKAESEKDKYEQLYITQLEEYSDLASTKEETIGNWIYRGCSTYTSKDKGVNNISSIGFDIAKWNMYTNFCAINIDDPDIEYGDTAIVQMPNGNYKAFLAVDTGAEVAIGELDLYFGSDLEGAFDFGRQKLKVWIIKGNGDNA